MNYNNDLENRIEKLEEKVCNLSGPKFIVLGKIKESVGVCTINSEWIVRGFYSLQAAQKFIDKLSLDLIDSSQYIDLEEENSIDEIVYEENGKLLDRFYRKYGPNVFGNSHVMLNCDKFVYWVERIEFEEEHEEDCSLIEKHVRNKDEF
jgi:hypothetical protein